MHKASTLLIAYKTVSLGLILVWTHSRHFTGRLQIGTLFTVDQLRKLPCVGLRSIINILFCSQKLLIKTLCTIDLRIYLFIVQILVACTSHRSRKRRSFLRV